eukprot:1190271-Prorocentrum_minimum.AAC.2
MRAHRGVDKGARCSGRASDWRARAQDTQGELLIGESRGGDLKSVRYPPVLIVGVEAGESSGGALNFTNFYKFLVVRGLFKGLMAAPSPTLWRKSKRSRTNASCDSASACQGSPERQGSPSNCRSSFRSTRVGYE